MLIDTHTHLNLLVNDFDTPLTDITTSKIKCIIEEAKKANVLYFINVGTNYIESINSIHLTKAYNEIFASIGIHPTDWHSEYQQDIKAFKKLIDEEKKIVGIGECGIDLFHKNVSLDKQTALFHDQIELALTHKKPLIIHSRNAYDETLTILEQYHKEPNFRGILHCFSYDYDFAQTVAQWNFLIGIGGVITYPKNQAIRETIQKIDLDKIVLETDAPFLPVQHMRGKQNHPKYIPYIAESVAQLKNKPTEIVATKTTKNAIKLFELQHLISINSQMN